MRKLVCLLALCVSAHCVDVNGLSIYFSPKGGCTDAVVGEIGRAEKEVLVQAYYLTSKPIVVALVEAVKRKVRVQIILDEDAKPAGMPITAVLKGAGVEVVVDPKHAIAHNKVMVVDDKVVLTGSFNFTAAAESRNAENLIVIRSSDVARVYRGNWLEHFGHCVPLVLPVVPVAPVVPVDNSKAVIIPDEELLNEEVIKPVEK